MDKVINFLIAYAVLVCLILFAAFLVDMHSKLYPTNECVKLEMRSHEVYRCKQQGSTCFLDSAGVMSCE